MCDFQTVKKTLSNLLKRLVRAGIDPLHLSYNNLASTTAVCGNAMSMYIPAQVYTLVPSLQPRISALVKPCVDYLLSLKMPSGNFPGSLESARTDKLVHWCHGAPGVMEHLVSSTYLPMPRGYVELWVWG